MPFVTFCCRGGNGAKESCNEIGIRKGRTVLQRRINLEAGEFCSFLLKLGSLILVSVITIIHIV